MRDVSSGLIGCLGMRIEARIGASLLLVFPPLREAARSSRSQSAQKPVGVAVNSPTDKPMWPRVRMRLAVNLARPLPDEVDGEFGILGGRSLSSKNSSHFRYENQ